MNKWKDADRISDKIVDLVREERKLGVSPVQLFAGQMLAMKSVLKTAPVEGRPGELDIVERSLDLCLTSMVRSARQTP